MPAARGNLRLPGRVQYADRAGPGDRSGVVRGLSPHGVLHAVSGGRGRRGAALPQRRGCRCFACWAGSDGLITTAFLMETWINVWGYPLNIAGRPLWSAGRRS